MPYSVAQPFADFERTVSTTAAVLEFVRAHSPSTRVVYPSSASVYGIAPDFPIKENSRLAPISPYGTHKLIAEQLVSQYSRQYRVPGSIVRLFSLYGCGLRKQLWWDACHKLARGDSDFEGTGDEERDWLHVDDAVKLLALAAENATPQCPTVNAGTGEGTTVRELLIHIAAGLSVTGPTPKFSGVRRIGDPQRYVADIIQASGWGWRPEKQWRKFVPSYLAWWRQVAGYQQSATKSN